MNLYLCGGGSGKQVIKAYKHLFKRINNLKPILYIPLAMDCVKYDDCYEWFKKEVEYINISSFEMVRSSVELSKKNLDDYSALFLGGGNTYKLLEEIKNNKNDIKIIDYLKNGGTVFGGSAGAIIFGNDIDVCKIDDKNENVDLPTKGFNYLNNYSILCHLKRKNFIKNKEYLTEYSEKNKVLYLPEDAVIYLSDRKITIIGNCSYILFKNSNYYIRKFNNLKKDFLSNK